MSAFIFSNLLMSIDLAGNLDDLAERNAVSAILLSELISTHAFAVTLPENDLTGDGSSFHILGFCSRVAPISIEMFLYTRVEGGAILINVMSMITYTYVPFHNHTM